MNKNVLGKYWGAILFRGILAIIFGLVALFWTKLTLELFVLFFAAYAIISGIVLIFGSFKAMKEHGRWWLFLLEGILGLAVGIVILTWPVVTVLILLYFVAIWAVVTGIIELAVGFSESEDVVGKWLLTTTGIISLIIGIIMLFAPVKTLEVVIWLVGLYALLFGISISIFSLQIKK